MGEVVSVDQERPDAAVVERAARVLREGGVAVVPTDSVYGICCAATPGNPGHERIFEIKCRDRAQTLPWFVADAADLDRYGCAVPAWARSLAGTYWPGALTLVVRASEAVPVEYAQPMPDGPTIALRVPNSELCRALVRSLGCPLAQTSAKGGSTASFSVSVPQVSVSSIGKAALRNISPVSTRQRPLSVTLRRSMIFSRRPKRRAR